MHWMKAADKLLSPALLHTTVTSEMCPRTLWRRTMREACQIWDLLKVCIQAWCACRVDARGILYKMLRRKCTKFDFTIISQNAYMLVIRKTNVRTETCVCFSSEIYKSQMILKLRAAEQFRNSAARFVNVDPGLVPR